MPADAATAAACKAAVAFATTACTGSSRRILANDIRVAKQNGGATATSGGTWDDSSARSDPDARNRPPCRTGADAAAAARGEELRATVDKLTGQSDAAPSAAKTAAATPETC